MTRSKATMSEPLTYADIEMIKETQSLECKLARGRDGQGKLPDDFWSTYSAMANTDGGVVLLGVREKRGRFTVEGVPQAEKVVQDLFNCLNNPNKVSVNLIQTAQVEVQSLDGHPLIRIHIPAANRKQKPVYLNGNPLGNTYRRLYDGDRLLDHEAVRRLLAEQLEDIKDRRILKGFTLEDLNTESLKVYRRLLSGHKPDHPFLEHDDLQFLKQLGCYRQDRETGESGFTLAGVLMFGNWQAIQEAVPHYFLDYQERDRNPDQRWTDRLIPDGTWSGNLFDFYRRVYRKLIADLKVPFAIREGQRQDDTAVHQALREALVNTLVHADFSARSAVRVIKWPGGFIFTNPGLMRIPLDLAYEGGQSDCRNQTLHQLFLMIGLGERAGSGIPKIIKGWQSQDWYQPVLSEDLVLEQTSLKMYLLSLVPQQIEERFSLQFGALFQSLDKQDRSILVMAAIEESLTPQRLHAVLKLHPTDASQALQRLTKQGFLQKHGQARGRVYTLTGTEVLMPEDVFLTNKPNLLSSTGLESSSTGLESSSTGLESSSTGLEPSSTGLEPSSTGLEEGLGKYVPELEANLIYKLDTLSEELLQSLFNLAEPVRKQKKIKREIVDQTVLNLCQGHYLTLNVLAAILCRNKEYLRSEYLNPLAQAQRLDRAFPMHPNDPRQAYRTAQTTRQEIPQT